MGRNLYVQPPSYVLPPLARVPFEDCREPLLAKQAARSFPVEPKLVKAGRKAMQEAQLDGMRPRPRRIGQSTPILDITPRGIGSFGSFERGKDRVAQLRQMGRSRHPIRLSFTSASMPPPPLPRSTSSIDRASSIQTHSSDGPPRVGYLRQMREEPAQSRGVRPLTLTPADQHVLTGVDRLREQVEQSRRTRPSREGQTPRASTLPVPNTDTLTDLPTPKQILQQEHRLPGIDPDPFDTQAYEQPQAPEPEPEPNFDEYLNFEPDSAPSNRPAMPSRNAHQTLLTAEQITEHLLARQINDLLQSNIDALHAQREGSAPNRREARKMERERRVRSRRASSVTQKASRSRREEGSLMRFLKPVPDELIERASDRLPEMGTDERSAVQLNFGPSTVAPTRSQTAPIPQGQSSTSTQQSPTQQLTQRARTQTQLPASSRPTSSTPCPPARQPNRTPPTISPDISSCASRATPHRVITRSRNLGVKGRDDVYSAFETFRAPPAGAQN